MHNYAAKAAIEAKMERKADEKERKATKATKKLVDNSAVPANFRAPENPVLIPSTAEIKIYHRASDVVELISRIIHCVLTYAMTERQASVVLNATTPLLRAIEQCRVEEELRELRDTVVRLRDQIKTNRQLAPIIPADLLAELADLERKSAA